MNLAGTTILPRNAHISVVVASVVAAVSVVTDAPRGF